MRGGEGMGEYPHAGVSPLHPVPHPSEKRYITAKKIEASLISVYLPMSIKY
jgi:hypothetical protein